MLFKRSIARFTVLLTLVVGGRVYAQGQGTDLEWNLSAPASRSAVVERLKQRSDSRRASAWQRAGAEGWSPKGEREGILFELQDFRGDRPFVYGTENVNAAISTAASSIRNVAPYSVNGSGITVGEWDGGAARSTHQELTGRVTVMDGGSPADHSTHVAGTIGASGIMPNALGMAPSVRIDSYEWNSDDSEMASRGMSTPGETGKIQLSNHSYGYITGWDTSSGVYRWYGINGYREDEGFGQYDSTAVDWDTLCYNAPYFLPCKSAGNDRNDNAPSAGMTYYYYSHTWKKATYDPATGPYSDGYDNGGFDTISYNGVAKNILTVGAVNDAVAGSDRSLANASLTYFTCWGPADDGRIKPDVVGNGDALYSSIGSSDTAYDTYSGTSMSSPNVCGTATLLVHYYGLVFPGSWMRASTLKGLLIHTADDLGNAGPDYKFGWGLVNAKAAADLIRQYGDSQSTKRITEASIDSSLTSRTNIFLWAGGTNAIRATLCWTDPPGTAKTGLDNTDRALVNDLDLRIIGPQGVVYQPYVLDRNNPAAPATTGDNQLDNVEQVFIATPAVTGIYSVVVSLDGALTGTHQVFSLILSGFVSTNTPTMGTPESWLESYGLTNYPPAVEEWMDTDGDGVPAWKEYVADTVPTNSDSLLTIIGFGIDENGIRIEWKGGRLATQYLQSCTWMSPSNEDWLSIFTNDALPTPITNILTGYGVSNPSLFFRIKAER